MHALRRRLEQNLVADDGFPRDLIIEEAKVLRGIKPSLIWCLHFLALAHVREFVAEEVYGLLSLANAARSFQDQEFEARGAAVRKPAVLCQPIVNERETLEFHQAFSQHVLHFRLFSPLR